MVKRLIRQTIWLTMLMGLWLPAYAGTLTAEPDKTKLYEGDVLTLTVKGITEIDLSLSNLFNLDLSSLPAPDIEKVSPDFEILARSQNYSMRTGQGDMQGELTWTYQLAPKSTGKLTIPALTFQDSVSDPVSIEVLDSSAADQAGINRDVFIELTADKAEVYVQEQLKLTVKLFFRGNLIRGELSEPQHPDAVIESLGKQSESSSYRDGVRYRVVERHYAVFPQKAGPLNLPAIRFEGQARDASGSLKYLRDTAQLYEVPVKEVPAAFSGSTWLPATNLTLREAGMPPTLNLETGDTLTRTLSLQASGLPSEALPSLSGTMPDGLRSYPEGPQRDTNTGPNGISSTLTQTQALVPVQAGSLTLPAIRIPWWDTKTDTEQIAMIPAQTLNVVPAKDSAPGATPAIQDTSTPVVPDNNSGENTATGKDTLSFWKWVSIALTGIWVLTMLAWWRTGRMAPPALNNYDPVTTGNEKAAFDQLLHAANEGKASVPGLFVAWANLYWRNENFRSASDVTRTFPAPDLEVELNRLQAQLFSRDHATSEWNASGLVKALKTLRGQTKYVDSKAGLPPLYPDNLSVSGKA